MAEKADNWKLPLCTEPQFTPCANANPDSADFQLFAFLCMSVCVQSTILSIYMLLTSQCAKSVGFSMYKASSCSIEGFAIKKPCTIIGDMLLCGGGALEYARKPIFWFPCRRKKHRTKKKCYYAISNHFETVG